METNLLRCVRALLSELEESFGVETWVRLCCLLDESSDFEAKQVAADYIQEHLGSRFWDLRLPIYAWWDAWRKEGSHPFEGMVTNWGRWVWDEGKHAGEVRELPSLPGNSMVWCPPGSFVMGSPTEEEGRDEDEIQRKSTILRGFWMGESLVTQGDFSRLMQENWWELEPNPSFFQHAGIHAPVENLTWPMAAAYCNRLSGLFEIPEDDWYYEIQGNGEEVWAVVRERWKGGGREKCRGFRLPTEVEWEYACRAGTTSARYGELDAIAWWGAWSEGGNSFASYEGAWMGNGGAWGTHPVKEKAPNEWGLYDMLGNVFEWCDDWFEDTLMTAPAGHNDGLDRVVRGCAWDSYVRCTRAAYRDRRQPSERGSDVGFRVVRCCDYA